MANLLGVFEKRKVECYDFETNELIAEYDSTVKAAAMHGISIASALRYKQKSKRRGSFSRALKKKVYFKYQEL